MLVPLRIDSVKVPLPFNMLHTEDMQKWSGKPEHLAFQRLLQAVSRHCPNRKLESAVDDKPIIVKKTKLPLKYVMATGLLFFGVLIGSYWYSSIVLDKKVILKQGIAETQVELEKLSTSLKMSPEIRLRLIKIWLDGDDKSLWVQAVKQLEVLADAGNAEASYILGDLYFVGGKGIERDPDNGCKWYHQAAKAGYLQKKNIVSMSPTISGGLGLGDIESSSY